MVAEGSPDVPALTRWQKVRMVVKVVELRLRFVALLAATGLVFGYWDTIRNRYETWSRPRGTVSSAAGPHAPGVEFYCPMHPNVVRGEAGSCPICGMPLSTRVPGAAEPLPDGVLSRVALGPLRVAQAGVRTDEIGYEPLAETVTTVGFVAYDERRLAQIAAKPRGMSRVESLAVNFVGTDVEAGQPLAELYSPELYQAIQELLLARKRANDAGAKPSGSVARSVLGDPQEIVQAAAEKLKLWGMTRDQVDAILRDGKSDYKVKVVSPIGGHVTKKNVVEGQYVSEGQPMFEVADLRNVWIQAQVYEDKLAAVRPGMAVEARVEAFPGEVFPGKVAFVQPHIDAATRTVEVRFDLDNPGRRLRPGMYATVTFSTPVSDTPAFRDHASHASAAGTGGQALCPVTSLRLGAMGEPVAVEVDGRKVWTCCGACEPKLKASPARYLARIAGPPKGSVLSVPESAVIDTGSKKVVYVEASPGVFEGRAVVLGPRAGDRYPVLDGLAPGDKVAAAGAFLLDAETRLNPPPASTPPPPAPAPKEKAKEKAAPRSASAADGRTRF